MARHEGFRAEYYPIADLKPYGGNPRRNEAAVAKVAASIEEFGWRQPIVVDEDMVILAGHTRLLAARQLGLDRVPVHVAQGLSASQRRAFRLADNRTAQEAEWDDAKLALEIEALIAEGGDVGSTGFNADEIARITAEVSAMLDGADPDDVPPVPDEPTARPGDLYQVGRHRVLCGDATVATDVDRLLGGAIPHLMVTDPPYGVEYDANWRNEAMPEKNDPNRWKDGAGRATGAVLNDDRADWREAWALFPGDVVYVWHAGNKAHVVATSLIDNGFDIRAQIIWGKSQLVIGRGHYHPKHEPCWYAVRSGATGHWVGDRKQTTLWDIDRPRKSDTGHSTQKPVECMRRPIENNSLPGDAVYDPFLGSGTTLMAAEVMGRICYGLELNPAYVDVIVRRWEQATGKKATLVQE